MTRKLHISDDLALPLEFLTSTQAIVAKKRVGKSYTAMVEAEELLEAKQQVVVLDPTGAWWGLRSSADGKSAGYPITILGGDHGDVALEATAGATIAEAIVTEQFSAVLDLTLFRKGERLRFAADFLETLYRLNREAMHLFLDEADVFAPQKTFTPEQARCLGAADELVRRGGIRGIGVTLISQRPQVLNKDVLSQIDMLVVLRMNHPKDIGAIRDWVVEHVNQSQAKAMLDSLPALPKGHAWVWAPAEEIFAPVTIREKRTFDSGRTPKAGERRAVPKVLAKVDLERLGATIAETVERTKANDPKALRARIAELEKQVAAKAPAVAPAKTVEKSVIKDAQLARIEKLIERGEKLGDRVEHKLQSVLAEANGELDTWRAQLGQDLNQLRAVAAIAKQTITSPQTGRQAGPRAAPPDSRPAATSKPAGSERRSLGVTAGETALPRGEAATLRALIQYPNGLRREQLTVLTGYKRSSRDAYIQRLREKDLVETRGDLILATQAGVDAMPNAEPLPTGAELRAFWDRELPEGERHVLAVLCDRYPNAVERDQIDEATGYKRSSRDAYLQRLRAKELVVDVARGMVQASPNLFEVAS